MNLVLLIISVLLAVGRAQNEDTPDDDCSPLIAERCFRQTWSELYGESSENFICGAVYDAILCSEDVIDDGCTKAQGRDNFDSWIRGLTAVHHFFCNDQKNHILGEFLRHIEPMGTCFNLTSFISCVERKTKVTHVVDMLYVSLDAVECNWVMISFATCGSKVSSPECAHIQEIISEALQIFFQEAGCAYTCGHAHASQPTVEIVLLILMLVSFCLTRGCKNFSLK